MREPIRSIDQYESVHMELDHKLRRYRVSERGWDFFAPTVKEWLSEGHAESLKAINPVSRIAFTKALYHQASRKLEAQKHIYFVTLISREHAFSLDTAETFDVKIHKEWIRQVVGAHDFIGFIEGAYFYKSPFLEDGQRPHISWHSHLLIWNVSPNEMKAKKARANNTFHTFVPGAAPFHFYAVDGQTALEKLLYMSKATLSEYAASPPAPDEIDPATGEVLFESTRKWRTQKRKIRPLALARMTAVIGGRSLKQLTVASGEGKNLRASALAATHQELKRLRIAVKLRLADLLSEGFSGQAGNRKNNL